MDIPEVVTKTGEHYVRDPQYENKLDTVVQHMKAGGFSDEQICLLTNLPMCFVESVNFTELTKTKKIE